MVSLTKRRLQFLNHLVEMYRKTKLPIHYEALARSLGVSKWTAYDMMKKMEQLGFITRSYETNPNETGRSQVVFVPTGKAEELFSSSGDQSLDESEWKGMAAALKERLRELSYFSLQDSLRNMLEEAERSHSSIQFCASAMGVLTVHLKKLGGKTEQLIRNMMDKAPDRDMGIAVFIGTALGSAIHSVNEELEQEASELAARLMQAISDLTGREKELLVAFLREALV